MNNSAMPLVSVIVPVYNVEKYLPKCLETISSQRYENVEILMIIDRSSSDGSEQLCRDYAKAHSEVRIISVEPCGVAVKRNLGIETALGEYIAFIDSDDWVEPGYLICLLSEIREKDADICVCDYFYGSEDDEDIFCGFKDETLITKEALRRLIRNDIPNYTWNKLFRKSLFQGVRFPEGKEYEDMAIMHLLFAKCRKVVVVSAPLYHYRKREGSLVANRNLKGRLDALEATIKQYCFILNEYPELEPDMAVMIYANLVSLGVASIFSSRLRRRELKADRLTLQDFIDNHIKDILSNYDMTERIIIKLLSGSTFCGDGLAIIMEYARRKLTSHSGLRQEYQ